MVISFLFYVCVGVCSEWGYSAVGGMSGKVIFLEILEIELEVEVY